jgi:uncharacterized membrane protein
VTPAASEAASLPVRVVLLVVLAGFGIALGAVGALGWTGRLRRSGRIGVRTAHALKTDDSFRLANRVAGPPVVVAGAAAVVGGVAAFALPTTVATVVAAAVGLLGAVFFARAGASLGDRAAAPLPAEPEPAASPCAGCVCGTGGCSVLSKGTAG